MSAYHAHVCIAKLTDICGQIVVAILLSGLNDQNIVNHEEVLQLTSFWETFYVFLQGGLVPIIVSTHARRYPPAS